MWPEEREQYIEAILVKLVYFPKDKNFSYPNKLPKGHKLPGYVVAEGRVIKAFHLNNANSKLFSSLDGSERNLSVSRNPREVYRDTVWFEYDRANTSEADKEKLIKEALEILMKCKQEKLDDAKLSIKVLKESIDFLKDSIDKIEDSIKE